LTYAAALHGLDSTMVSVLHPDGAHAPGARAATFVWRMFDIDEHAAQKAMCLVRSSFRRCPNNHELRDTSDVNINRGPIVCDVCGVGGSLRFLTCLECDHDICESCLDSMQGIALFYTGALRRAEAELRTRHASAVTQGLASSHEDTCLAMLGVLSRESDIVDQNLSDILKLLEQRRPCVQCACVKVLRTAVLASSLSKSGLRKALKGIVEMQFQSEEVQKTAKEALLDLKGSGVIDFDLVITSDSETIYEIEILGPLNHSREAIDDRYISALSL